MTVATANAKDGLSNRPAYTGRPNPVNVAYEKKMSELDVRISTAKAKLEDLFVGGRNGGSAAEREARNGLFEEQKKLREQMRPLLDQRRKMLDMMNKLKEDLKKKTGEVKDAKDKLPFRTIPEMEQRVADLERKIESGQFKLIEEKQILSEISRLKKARRELENIDGSNSSVGSMKLRIEKIKSDLALLDDKLAPLRGQSDAIQKKIDDLNGNRKDDKVSREERQASIDKLKKEIEGYYEERRNAYDEYKVAKKAQAEARIKRDARRAEMEKRRVFEDELEELEEKLLAFNPETITDKKVAECNNLKAYFQELLEKKEEDSSNDGNIKKINNGLRQVSLSAEFADAVPINKKKVEENFVTPKNGGKKKSANKEHENASTANIGKRLPFHILSGLADLGFSIPSTSAEIPELLKALDAKKTSFESKQDDSMIEKEKQRQAIVDKINELKKKLAEPIVVNTTESQ